MKLTTMAAGAALALGLALASGASAQITASGGGWINAEGSANNGAFADGDNNTFSGFEGEGYNNWFTFVLPNSAITAATVSIFNSGSNSTIDPDAVYSLHAPTDFSFLGLQAGDSLGSITLGAADTGADHFVDITLNAAGLSYLNANLGNKVAFGGTIASSVDPTNCFDCVAAFGYSGGQPAAELTLNAGGVPEPAAWALMIAGFGGAGAMLRRRRTLVLAA